MSGAASAGQAAYEKWCALLNWPKLDHIRPLGLLAWGRLPAPTKAIWEVVAAAAIEVHEKRRLG